MEAQRRFGELRSVEEKDRTAVFVISTATRDRHRTVLNPENWKLDNYRKNPIVAYDHDVFGGFFTGANPDSIIGKSEVWAEGRDLMGRVVFEPADMNPLADKIFKKIQFGTLRSASVSFFPVKDNEGKEGKWGEKEEAKGEKNETFYYNGQELLEWSIVNIPSNPDAVKKAAPKDKAAMLRWIIEQLSEGIEVKGLTVEGLLSILDGDDVKKVLEADIGCKLSDDDIKRLKLNDFVKIQLDRLVKHKF